MVPTPRACAQRTAGGNPIPTTIDRPPPPLNTTIELKTFDNRIVIVIIIIIIIIVLKL
jgi:hypothetical protein